MTENQTTQPSPPTFTIAEHPDLPGYRFIAGYGSRASLPDGIETAQEVGIQYSVPATKLHQAGIPFARIKADLQAACTPIPIGLDFEPGYARRMAHIVLWCNVLLPNAYAVGVEQRDTPLGSTAYERSRTEAIQHVLDLLSRLTLPVMQNLGLTTPHEQRPVIVEASQAQGPTG